MKYLALIIVLFTFALVGCNVNPCGNENTISLKLATPLVRRDSVRRVLSMNEMSALMRLGKLQINVQMKGSFIGSSFNTQLNPIPIVVDSSLKNTLVASIVSSTTNIDRRMFPLRDTILNSMSPTTSYVLWIGDSLPAKTVTRTKETPQNELQCSLPFIPHTIIEDFVIRISPDLPSTVEIKYY